MANGFGVTYQPGSADRSGEGTPSGARRMSPQESVKILSLRVPERANPTAPINRGLLTSPGSAAPGASALNSLVAQLQQAFKAMPPIPNAPMMPAPLPSPGRAEVPGAIPTPVDTGVIGPGVRGPQGPQAQPSPQPQPSPVDNPQGMPAPLDMTPMWLDATPPEVPLAPTAPQAPKVIPGDDTHVGTATEPPPSLFEASAEIPWWQRKEQMDSLFNNTGIDTRMFETF
jgi:hypothetical protein